VAPARDYHHPNLNEVALPAALLALADPSRVSILCTMLAAPEREFACNEFALELSKATISHHFETLRAAGLIHTRVEGNRCLSSLRQAEFEARFPGLLRLVEKEVEIC
jgi:DNA-binding transcriptional ArsR family regulator